MVDKIQLIKIYRAHTGCGLIDAKRAIEDFMSLACLTNGRQPEWEYFGVKIFNPPDTINEYGALGWELSAIDNDNVFYFKRRK